MPKIIFKYSNEVHLLQHFIKNLYKKLNETKTMQRQESGLMNITEDHPNLRQGRVHTIG